MKCLYFIKVYRYKTKNNKNFSEFEFYYNVNVKEYWNFIEKYKV